MSENTLEKALDTSLQTNVKQASIVPEDLEAQQLTKRILWKLDTR